MTARKIRNRFAIARRRRASASSFYLNVPGHVPKERSRTARANQPARASDCGSGTRVIHGSPSWSAFCAPLFDDPLPRPRSEQRSVFAALEARTSIQVVDDCDRPARIDGTACRHSGRPGLGTPATTGAAPRSPFLDNASKPTPVSFRKVVAEAWLFRATIGLKPIVLPNGQSDKLAFARLMLTDAT